MDKARWARIREIFGHLADKSPSHRTDYLDMVCEDDAELRREVEELLEANDSLDEHHEQAPWAAAAEALGVSKTTVFEDLKGAKAWLAREIGQP